MFIIFEGLSDVNDEILKIYHEDYGYGHAINDHAIDDHVVVISHNFTITFDLDVSYSKDTLIFINSTFINCITIAPTTFINEMAEYDFVI